MCAIALNCLSLLMHATQITQAAKYTIMTVTCLIERRQNSLVYLHEIGHKNLQLERFFHISLKSLWGHVKRLLLVLQINHILLSCSPQVAKCCFNAVYPIIKHTPTGCVIRKLLHNFVSRHTAVPYWTLSPVLVLTWQPPDFRLCYWHSRLKQPGHQCP